MKNLSSVYNEDYFECGAESGKSLYSNFRWMPELTIPLAHQLINILGLLEGDKVLDFGCAKGYLVKALRLLHIDAYGVDCSEYALQAAPGHILPYLSSSLDDISLKPLADGSQFKAIIAKDVLEHLTVAEVKSFLQWARRYADMVFVIVPLGDGERYVIPSYELDVTHVIRESLYWWKDMMSDTGWQVTARYSWGHMKENWLKQHVKGNGFLLGV